MAQYHVTLNGNGYLANLDKYQRRPAAVFAPKRSEGAPDVGDFLMEEGLRVSDWSGGEGYLQLDPERPERWRAGTGMDVYSEPGSLRIGPNLAFVSGSNAFTAEHTVATVYKGNLYTGTGAGDIYKFDGTTWTLSRATGKAGGIRALAVFNNLLYAANGTDGVVDEFNGTAWTAAKFTAAGSSGIRAMAVFYRQTAQYLYVVSHRAVVAGIYWWDGATLSALQYAPEEIGDRAVALVLRNRLYFFVGDTTSKRMGIYSVDDSGSGGVYRAHATVEGNHAAAGAVHEGVAYLGAGRRGVVWSWDGTDLREIKRLGTAAAPHTDPIGGVATWERALWVSFVSGTNASGLLRYDLVGWTRPFVGLDTTSAGPRGLAVFNDQLHVLTARSTSAGVWATATTYGGSATQESGLFDAGLPSIDKVFRSVAVTHLAMPSGQSIQVQYRLEDSGSWTVLGTSSTTNATSATFNFSGTVVGKQIAFRVVLAGSAGSASTPVLYDVLLRFALAPAVKREWELPIVLEGTAELPQVTLDGTANPRTGVTMTLELWTAKAVAGPVTFVDVDGVSRSVYFVDLKEEVAELSQRRGYQTVAKCRLVEA